MQTDTDVLIVGRGLNGPALALALAEAGLTSIVIDATAPGSQRTDSFDGRAYALSLTSRRMLAALGLWAGLAAHAQPILSIKVSDGRPGEGASPLFLHFDHAEIEEGPMGHIIEDRFLRRAIGDAVAANSRISLLAPVEVTGQVAMPGHAAVTLADGRTLTGRLLVGADGRTSATAARAGIRRTGWDYDQTSLVCAIDHALPHDGIAHQFFTPSGPLAILPLPGNASSIVWTETTARARAIMTLDNAGFLAALVPHFGSFLGTIALSGLRHAYPLGLSLANSFTAPRMALVGDAAHGIHPLAGQGLNLGFRDVAALAEVVSDAARRGEDFGSAPVLDRYQRWRRFDTAALAVATDAVNRAFSNDNPLLRLGRDLALGALNVMPAARRGLIRQATGLTGDLPRLMRGLPA
jgi:2-octaprenyl-6-methoxyphenol hydroxylase